MVPTVAAGLFRFIMYFLQFCNYKTKHFEYSKWNKSISFYFIVLGNTIKPKRHLLGNNGLVKLPTNFNMTSSFPKWIQQGFPHHICVVSGHHGQALFSLAQHCQVTVVESVLYD